jgi:hypothetical protein
MRLAARSTSGAIGPRQLDLLPVIEIVEIHVGCSLLE